jgi:hypothetical protein
MVETGQHPARGPHRIRQTDQALPQPATASSDRAPPAAEDVIEPY